MAQALIDIRGIELTLHPLEMQIGEVTFRHESLVAVCRETTVGGKTERSLSVRCDWAAGKEPIFRAIASAWERREPTEVALRLNATWDTVCDMVVDLYHEGVRPAGYRMPHGPWQKAGPTQKRFAMTSEAGANFFIPRPI